MALTSKQNQFVHEYIVDHNPTEAAIRAGYSKNRAVQTGQGLMANPEVRLAIKEALRTIVFSDIRDFINTDEAGKIKPKRLDEIPKELAICVEELSEVITSEGREITIKLRDKIAAAHDLIRLIKEDLDATKVITLPDRNGRKTKLTVPDHDIRLAAVEEAFRLKGFDL